jgi:hypothetical protein
MKKNPYEILRLQIISLDQEDVITTSVSDWQGQYDDKGSWDPSWFAGNE